MGGLQTNVKRLFKYTMLTMIILVCIFSLSGCFDRRELDTIGIVMGVALDKAEGEGQTEVTVQMANPEGKSESKGKESMEKGGGGGEAFINVSSTGGNINYIIREMQHKMSRRIYVPHSQAIVIGEDLAKNGVKDALDFFARAPEARMTLNLFIAKGKASEVLGVTPEFEKMPATELVKILKDQKITSNAPIITEFEFINNMISKTTAPVAPIVSVFDDEGTERLYVGGCAVFKQSVMVGELDEDQTRGMLFVKSKVKTGVFQLNVLNTPTTIEIRKSKAKVNPVLYDDGTVVFNIEVQLTVGIGDQSGTVNLADPDNSAAVISASTDAVKKEIQSAFDKSKELNADIFGFGEYLNRKYPDQWKDMKEKWNELYQGVAVNIQVDCKTDGAGRIGTPLIPQGA